MAAITDNVSLFGCLNDTPSRHCDPPSAEKQGGEAVSSIKVITEGGGLKLLSSYYGDVHDKKTRSYNMSQIRVKNTNLPGRQAGPEMPVRKFLHVSGFHYPLCNEKLQRNLI